jgi:hypothetical protein
MRKKFYFVFTLFFLYTSSQSSSVLSSSWGKAKEVGGVALKKIKSFGSAVGGYAQSFFKKGESDVSSKNKKVFDSGEEKKETAPPLTARQERRTQVEKVALKEPVIVQKAESPKANNEENGNALVEEKIASQEGSFLQENDAVKGGQEGSRSKKQRRRRVFPQKKDNLDPEERFFAQNKELFHSPQKEEESDREKRIIAVMGEVSLKDFVRSLSEKEQEAFLAFFKKVVHKKNSFSEESFTLEKSDFKSFIKSLSPEQKKSFFKAFGPSLRQKKELKKIGKNRRAAVNEVNFNEENLGNVASRPDQQITDQRKKLLKEEKEKKKEEELIQEKLDEIIPKRYEKAKIEKKNSKKKLKYKLFKFLKKTSNKK